MKRRLVHIAVVVAALAVVASTATHGYLLFHSVAETFALVVAAGVFMVAWNARRFLHDNHYLLFQGIAIVFVAVLDLLHMLAYRGMGVFLAAQDSANLATQLWIGGRYLLAFSLLVAPLFLLRRLNALVVFSVYVLVTVVLLSAIFGGWFPVCYVDGAAQPLTGFKIVSEYLICLILLLAGVLLVSQRRRLDPRVLRLMLGSIALAMAAELTFTFYSDVYGLLNLLGHLFKIAQYYLLYRAIVAMGLNKPYALMFHDLDQSRRELAAINEKLEDRVARRTAVLDQRTTQLRDLALKLEQTERRERDALAHSLHDELAQLLALARMKLSLLRQPRNPEDARRYADELDSVLGQAIVYTRTLISELRPPMLQDEGLTPALDWLAEKMQTHGLNVAVEGEVPALGLSQDLRALLFIAVRELLMNVVKHAHADRATVRLGLEGSFAVVSVEDQGDGFDPAQLPSQAGEQGGFGLASLRQRLELAGGLLVIDASPGQGARFTLRVPRDADVPNTPAMDSESD